MQRQILLTISQTMIIRLRQSSVIQLRTTRIQNLLTMSIMMRKIMIQTNRRRWKKCRLGFLFHKQIKKLLLLNLNQTRKANLSPKLKQKQSKHRNQQSPLYKNRKSKLFRAKMRRKNPRFNNQRQYQNFQDKQTLTQEQHLKLEAFIQIHLVKIKMFPLQVNTSRQDC